MKKLLLAPDTLFLKTPDGKYWSDTIYSYSFFQRYMSVFEKLIIVSRCRDASYDEVKNFLRSDGPNIEIREIPAMQGMAAYIKNIVAFSKSAKAACSGVDCGLIRLPSVPAAMVLHYFKKLKKPYALEIVADPYDAYATNKIARLFFTWHMKRECLYADGVSYVTKEYLQKKYPSHNRKYLKTDYGYFESYYSTIRLSDGYFSLPRDYSKKKHFEIIHTANNMNNALKGHEILIKSAKKVLDKGYDIDVKFIGDGSLRKDLEKLSEQLGINDKVHFIGKLANPEEIRNHLLKADLFVFPTKAEGLPRSIIEAMAVGLPCISTPVAGIPELLEKDDMLDPENIDLFARRIEDFITNVDLMNEKSKRNIKIAKNYRESVLKKRRDEFYQKLKNLAEKSYEGV